MNPQRYVGIKEKYSCLVNEINRKMSPNNPISINYENAELYGRTCELIKEIEILAKELKKDSDKKSNYIAMMSDLDSKKEELMEYIKPR